MSNECQPQDKPLVIPGWPHTTEEDIRHFQRINKLEVDGLVGPQTRGACWREPKQGGRITYLSWHGRHNGAAETSRTWTAARLEEIQECLPLKPRHMLTLIGLCYSSEWETGYDFLSTEDGITYGLRRYAARTFARFVRTHRDLFQRYLGVYDAHRLGDHRDQPTNGWPLCDPRIRAGMIAACQSRMLWRAQLEELIQHTAKLLKAHTWARSGREIALLVRISNSRSAWVDEPSDVPARDYQALVDMYTDEPGPDRDEREHPRGDSRVRRIEAAIPAGEVWR